MTDATAIRKLREQVEAGEVGAGLNTSSVFSKPADMLAVDAFHGSLDAALDLHKALLPGWWWGVGLGDELANVLIGFDCEDEEGDHFVEFGGEGLDMPPARAWLIAILRALEAQEKGEANEQRRKGE